MEEISIKIQNEQKQWSNSRCNHQFPSAEATTAAPKTAKRPSYNDFKSFDKYFPLFLLLKPWSCLCNGPLGYMGHFSAWKHPLLASVREQMFGIELCFPCCLCHSIQGNVHEKQGRALGFHFNINHKAKIKPANASKYRGHSLTRKTG